jgi:hypothetical protein
MMSAQETPEPPSKRQFDTLLIDASTALASLDPETTETEESRQRKRQNAHRTYESIRHRLATISLSPIQKISLNKKLTLLRFRLS